MRGACSLVLAAVAFAAQAQLPPPPPLLTPFADNQQWVVERNFVYQIGNSPIAISVPRGFVTDFASIPQTFWSLGLTPNSTYSRAAIVHDYLYWTQGCTRLQADNLFLIAMKESRVGTVTRDAVYQGVRLGGGASWDANAAARQRGLPRVIPERSMAIGALDLWPAFQQRLAAAGVTDPPLESTPAPAYCAIGDTTDVPDVAPPPPLPASAASGAG